MDIQMDIQQETARLAEQFAACSKLLSAMGDETRQHIILEMLQMGHCSGVRVGEITKKTNLSRPAVSHHLRIMKEAGLVKVRREGTKNYYYFDPSTETFDTLRDTLKLAQEIVKTLPDRQEEV